MTSTALFLGLLLSSTAQAWTPGPYGFERCVSEFETAVRGQIRKVETVDKKDGGWVLARATLDVKRAYYGMPKDTKKLAFYFWSQTDGTFTVSHKLSVGDKVLVFLSTNLDALSGMKVDGVTKHFLRFSKGDLRGYLYEVFKSGDTEMIRDQLMPNGTPVLPLSKAEELLASRKP